jgi:hypothetical protein
MKLVASDRLQSRHRPCIDFNGFDLAFALVVAMGCNRACVKEWIYTASTHCMLARTFENCGEVR